MTEAERKKRSQKSAVIVERLVRTQLRAMGCDRFDLGIRRDAGEMMLANGYLDHAKALLIKAGELARDHGRDWIERRARLLMDGLS